MKIGWITYDWRTDTGGKGVGGTAFMNTLADRGHELTLIDLEMTPGGKTHIDRSRLRESIVLNPYWTRGMKGVVTSLPRLIKEVRQYDLVVIGAAPNIDLVLLLALIPFRFLHRAKLVRLEFTNPRTYLNHSGLAKVYDFLGRMLFPRLDRTVSPSQGAADQIVEHYGAKRENSVVVPWPCIPAGFGELTAAGVPEPLFNAARPKVLAITVMRLSLQDKDFDTLLKAFRRIHEETGAELAVLGAGDPAPIEELIAREKLEGKVHLLGERKNPYSYVAKADLFLFASKYEGNPLVLAEAAACGCPIVATDCDFGPREIIDDGVSGFLVPVRNPERLADQAIKLINDPELRRSFAEAGLKNGAPYGVAASSTAFAVVLEEIVRR